MDMERQLLDTFCAGTVECFDMMMDLTPNLVEVIKEWPPLPSAEVCAIIGLSGDLQGIAALTFDEDVAIQLTEHFLGEPVPKMDEGVLDACGEMINIIAGMAKAETDLSISISLPSILHGESFYISAKKHTVIRAARFEIPDIGEMKVILGTRMEQEQPK